MAMAGERVLYLDRENPASLTKDRLKDAVAGNPDAFDEPTLRENFDPRNYPTFKLWEPDDFGDVIAAEGFLVVCFDSVRELCAQLNLSANSDDEFSKLYNVFGTALAKRGITPLFFDNVGNKNKHRTTGTHAKMDAAPQGYHVKALHRFSPETTGTIEVRCTRSRYGDDVEGWRWHMTLGGGVWELPTRDLQEAALSTNARILAALGEEDRKAADVAAELDIDTQTVMRHVEEINTEEEHDSDEDYGKFKAPISVTKEPGRPTLLRLRGEGLPI